MKKDIVRIMREKGYCGGDNICIRRNRREARYDPENALCIKSMKKIHWFKGGEGKEHNYSYRPLEKYLHKHLGKNWNDIHSDICKTYKKGTKERYFIDNAIESMVTTTGLFLRDGILYTYMGYTQSPSPLRGEDFYVDPVDGTLKISSKDNYKNYLNARKEEWNKRRIVVSNELQYHKIRGIWYEIELEKINLIPHPNFRWKYSISINHKGYKILEEIWDDFMENFPYNYYRAKNGNLIVESPGSVLSELFPSSNYEGYSVYYMPISKKQLNSKQIKKMMASYVQP